MWRRWLTPGIVLFFVLWLGLMITGRQAMFRDPGTFWHVAAGNQILQTGHVPREDPFSFTRAGRAWVADQWLAETAMALVHRAAGWEGLLTATAAILAATGVLLAGRFLRAGLHLLPTAVLLALVALAATHQFLVRPLVLTFLGTVILYAWLLDVDSGRRRVGALIWLLPMIALWVNLHGGVLGGLGMLGLAMAGWIASRAAALPGPIQNLRQALGGGALVAVAFGLLLLNPYGLEQPRWWWKTLIMPLPGIIQEHRRTPWNEPLAWAAIILAGMYLVVLIRTERSRLRITWFLPLVWMLLALSRVRHVPLFAATAALALAEMLPYSRAAVWLKRRGWLAEAPDPAAESRAATARGGMNPARVFCVIGFLILVFCFQTQGIRLPVVGRDWVRFDPRIAPEKLLESLDDIAAHAPPDGEKIFNDLNFGGFLIYHTAPRLKVFVDDRCALYGGDFLAAYDRARRRRPEQIEHWRRQYGFRYALVEAEGRFDRYLARCGRWTALARTATAALYQCDLVKTADRQ